MTVTPAMVRAVCRRIAADPDRVPTPAQDKVLVLAVQRDIEHDIALEAMLRGHRGLVYRVASKWARVDLFDDAVSVGMLGMAAAIRRYDPDRGIKFSTYATHWIESKIRRTTVQGIHHAHVPEHNLYRWLRLKRWYATFHEEHSRYPEDDEIMAHFGFTAPELEHVRSVGLMEMQSIDGMPVGLDQSRDLTQVQSPETFVLEGIEMEKLSTAISQLDPIQRYILRRVYGLDSEMASMRVIGEEIGMTSQAVHQRLKTIHKILRKAME